MKKTLTYRVTYYDNQGNISLWGYHTDEGFKKSIEKHNQDFKKGEDTLLTKDDFEFEPFTID